MLDQRRRRWTNIGATCLVFRRQNQTHRRQILTSEDGPRAERINHAQNVMTADQTTFFSTISAIHRTILA